MSYTPARGPWRTSRAASRTGASGKPRECDMSFAGKTVMVTGGAGTLGRAVAEHFSGLGANLVLLDLKGQGDEKELFIVTDLLDQKSVDAAAAKTIERFGRIDVLANIAGGFRMGKPVHETADA